MLFGAKCTCMWKMLAPILKGAAKKWFSISMMLFTIKFLAVTKCLKSSIFRNSPIYAKRTVVTHEWLASEVIGIPRVIYHNEKPDAVLSHFEVAGFWPDIVALHCYLLPCNIFLPSTSFGSHLKVSWFKNSLLLLVDFLGNYSCLIDTCPEWLQYSLPFSTDWI